MSLVALDRWLAEVYLSWYLWICLMSHVPVPSCLGGAEREKTLREEGGVGGMGDVGRWGGRGRRRQRSGRGGRGSLLHFIFLQKVGWDKAKLLSKLSTVEPVTILKLRPSINLIMVIVCVYWYHVSIYGNPVSHFDGELQVWIWVGRVFLGNIVIHRHHFLVCVWKGKWRQRSKI